MPAARKKALPASSPPPWRDVLPVHPACELARPMTQAELRELGEDIKANGLKQPITIWAEPEDPQNPRGKRRYALLDGRSRLDAMAAAGISFALQWGNGGWQIVIKSADWLHGDPPAPLEVDESDVGDPVAYVKSLNAHRRHLTPDEKRKLIAAALVAHPEKSDRQHGEEQGVDHKTIARERTKLVKAGKAPQLGKRTGKDGKARKTPTRSSPKPKSESEPASTSTTQVPPPSPPMPVATLSAGDDVRQIKRLFEAAIVDAKRYARQMPTERQSVIEVVREFLVEVEGDGLGRGGTKLN